MESATPYSMNVADIGGRLSGHQIALGRIDATPRLVKLLGGPASAATALKPFIEKHARGDWGHVTSSVKERNLSALQMGTGKIRSAHQIPGSARLFWVVTESDRRFTTAMLSDET